MEELSRLTHFVFCSSKTGGHTLLRSLAAALGNDRVFHVHADCNFKERYPGGGSIFYWIMANSKKFDRVWIIDSYREPFERSIAAFFQNIDLHCPDWKSQSVDWLIDYFNEHRLYWLDSYHSYHESWGHFGLSTDVVFDFEKGYVLREKDNFVFVKTRLREAHRWTQIFSAILGTDLEVVPDNLADDKEYSETYALFRQKYRLPPEAKQSVLALIAGDPLDSGTDSPFYVSWSEMKKFMTHEEIFAYFKKWGLIGPL